MLEPQPEHDDRHEHRAGGLGTQHETPARLADGLVRGSDERAEHADDADVDGVEEPEGEDDDPEPLAAGELRPALAQLAHHRRPARATRLRPGQTDAARQTMATAYVRASTASAQPGPTPTTSRPAIAGPMMPSPLRLKESSALACWSRVRSTTSGTMPIIAGIVKAETAPLMPSMTVSWVSVACPEMRSAAATRLREAGEHVRDLEHDDAREPVGDDAPDEEEDDHRQGAHAEHLGQRAGGRVDVQHREGERDRHHDRARGRDRARREVPREPRLTERAE